MSKLKIRKVGNSLGVILPKEVQTALNASEGDVIEFTPLENGTAVLGVALPHHSEWKFPDVTTSETKSSKSTNMNSEDQDWLDASLEEEDDEIPAW